MDRLVSLWIEIANHLRQRVWKDMDEKAAAKRKCFEFVEQWIALKGGQVSHYMHILARHADWFFGIQTAS
jgi:hypothetical protein